MSIVFELVQEDTFLKRVSHDEYAGPCPVCGGRDRFHINLNKRGGSGGFMCRSCWPAESRGWGDAIDYLRHVRKMSFQAAKAYLAGRGDTTPGHVEPQHYSNTAEPPVEQWQKEANVFVQEAIARLWSTPGQAALDYLHRRGFHDEIIKQAQLGYTAHTHHGKRFPVLTIPWQIDGVLWRVNLRNLNNPLPPDEPKYINRYGSSNAGLYLADCLKNKRTTFLVEGELDALSIVQEAGDVCNVVASGSTGGSRGIKWLARLACQPRVFVAYDSEEKGEKAAGYWLDRLAKATRYHPYPHDCNEMLQRGYDVRTWVEAAPGYVAFNDLWAKGCAMCGCEPEAISRDGQKLYCLRHAPRELQQAA